MSMDWTAIWVSAKLALLTLLVLLPMALLAGRWLALTSLRGKAWIEGLLALPLVLPPTVLGYYMLLAMGSNSIAGNWFEAMTGQTLAFSFTGLVIASVIFNIPFAVMPIQRAFESLPQEIHEAAQCCGMNPWRTFRQVELPLVWPGLLSAAVMTFAHTLGEFGVVLMVGGNIPAETRTVAISIYDRVQGFDFASAGAMSLLLLLISLATIAVSYGLTEKLLRRRQLP